MDCGKNKFEKLRSGLREGCSDEDITMTDDQGGNKFGVLQDTGKASMTEAWRAGIQFWMLVSAAEEVGLNLNEPCWL